MWRNQSGKRSVDWKDVREYLKGYVGEFYTIASTEDVVYIGSDLPKEYSGSKYTNNIKGTNAKAKANASTGLPEMIEIAVGKHFRENQEDKHKRDAFMRVVQNRKAWVKQYNNIYMVTGEPDYQEKSWCKLPYNDIMNQKSNCIIKVHI